MSFFFFFFAKTKQQTSPDTALLWQTAFCRANSLLAGLVVEVAAFKGLLQIIFLDHSAFWLSLLQL